MEAGIAATMGVEGGLPHAFGTRKKRAGIGGDTCMEKRQEYALAHPDERDSLARSRGGSGLRSAACLDDEPGGNVFRRALLRPANDALPGGGLSPRGRNEAGNAGREADGGESGSGQDEVAADGGLPPCNGVVGALRCRTGLLACFGARQPERSAPLERAGRPDRAAAGSSGRKPQPGGRHSAVRSRRCGRLCSRVVRLASRYRLYVVHVG